MLLFVLIALQAVLLVLAVVALVRRPAPDPRIDALGAQVGALGGQVSALGAQLAGTAAQVSGVREDARALVGERFDLVRADLAQALSSLRAELAGALAASRQELAAAREEQSAALARSREETAARLAEWRAETAQVLGRMGESLQSLGAQLAAQIEAVREESRRAIEERFGAAQERIAARLDEMREKVEARLGQSLDKSAAVFKDVSDRLGDLKLTNDRIVGFSQSLNELQSLLQSPKLRGNLGEFTLEQMLGQALPPEGYALQASLGGRERVDAAIHLKHGILCIDSKFPLESWRRLQAAASEEDAARARKQFERDVKAHAASLAQKYIVPEVTLDFALMFIPAEGVYYAVASDPALLEALHALRVVPVSPTTLFAHLQVIALGFRGMKIEEEARRVEKILGELKKRFDVFKGHFDTLGGHLDKARSKFDEVAKDVTRFDTTISGLRVGALAEAETGAAPVQAFLSAGKAA